MKFYSLGHKKDGVFHYNQDRMKAIVENLFDGNYLISFQKIDPLSDVKEYRACYFAKVDMLAEEVGETRYPLHSYIKESVLAEMLAELPELFAKPLVSTQYLTIEGWKHFLQRFDLWAFTNYNVMLA